MVMWGLAAGTLAPHGEAHSPDERPPPAFTHGCGCGPFKHKAELTEGKKREKREWEEEGEGKGHAVEFLQIKALKWGNCHTGLIS